MKISVRLPRRRQSSRSGLYFILFGVTLAVQAVFLTPAQAIQDKLTFASRDINEMWARQFQQLGRSWVSPRVYIYSGRIQTPCGVMNNWNAQYCPRNHSIYLNEPFVRRINHQVGDFAAITVLAHEYGHAVQRLLGLSTVSRYPVQDELQVDCFAGFYAQDANRRKLLDPGDIPEATAQSYASGDPAFDLNAHGTPNQRVRAFHLGFDQGFQSCLSYSTWHQRFR